MTELRCRKTETLSGDKEEEERQNEPVLQTERKLSQYSSLLTES